MRRFLAVMIAVGCTGQPAVQVDNQLSDVGPCASEWNERTDGIHVELCQSGCVYVPSMDTTRSCEFTDEIGDTRTLPWSFVTYRGLRGVCTFEREFDARHAIVRFFPCTD